MSEQKLSTKAIRTQIERTQYMEHSNPLFLTSSFVFEDSEEMRASFAEEKERNIYSRFTNPNNSELVQKMCKLEGAEDGYAFATGMSAIFSTFAALLNAGDHIISFRAVFGSTHTLFTKFFPRFPSPDSNDFHKIQMCFLELPRQTGGADEHGIWDSRSSEMLCLN